MSKHARLPLTAFFLVSTATCSVPPAGPPTPIPTISTHSIDHSSWDRVVRRHVRPVLMRDIQLNGVDYAALKQGDADYTTYLEQLSKVDLQGLGRDELLALWINAYNALCIHVVLEHWPLESIRDAGGAVFDKVWSKPAGVVAGKMRTLDEIEHQILRPMGEPLIHASIVCASVSCPDLRTEAFVAKNIHQQLEDQMALFLANPGKGLRVERDAKRVTVSSIFKWFSGDFGSDGALPFVIANAPEADRAWLDSNKAELKVNYFDYDWGLNTASKE